MALTRYGKLMGQSQEANFHLGPVPSAKFKSTMLNMIHTLAFNSYNMAPKIKLERI